MAVNRHKLGEVENECTYIILSSWPSLCQKLSKFDKVMMKKILTVSLLRHGVHSPNKVQSSNTTTATRISGATAVTLKALLFYIIMTRFQICARNRQTFN